jgi:homeobox protein cut-like
MDDWGLTPTKPSGQPAAPAASSPASNSQGETPVLREEEVVVVAETESQSGAAAESGAEKAEKEKAAGSASTERPLPQSLPRGGGETTETSHAVGADAKSKSDGVQLAQLRAHLQTWRGVELSGMKSKWDAQAADIVDAKDRAAISRRKLGLKTKEFRTLAPEQRMQALGGLIRVFQEEVDALTGRAKFAESAFVAVYKTLGEAPDPVVGLAAAEAALAKGIGAGTANRSVQEQLAKCQLENKRLLKELDEFHRDFQHVRNQEVTIRRLEDQLAAVEGSAEQSLSSALAEQEADLRAEQSRVEDMLREQLQEQTRRADKAQDDAASCRRQLEGVQQELLTARVGAEDRGAAVMRENDMLRTESENYRERILSLERERDELLAAGDDVRGEDRRERERKAAEQTELALVQKDIEISQLMDALESQRQSSRQGAGARDALRAVQQKLDEETKRSSDLQQQLESAPTQAEMDDLRQQLAVMESVEFGDKPADEEVADDDDSDTASVATGNTASTWGSSKTDVAVMFRKKCKKLETDNANLRVRCEEVERARGIAESQLANTEEQRDNLQGLVSSLETDLERAQTQRTQDEPGEFTPPQERKASGNAGTPAGASDASMLQIVSAQRDRFKDRIVELEAERSERQRAADANSGELEKLRRDNVALYEKIRYLQSFSNKEAGREGARSRVDDVESRYKTQYEEQINPFAAFSRNQRREQIDELAPAERVLLRATEVFLQTKLSRYFIVIYSLALHVIVFITLYRSAHAAGCDPAVMYAAQQHERLQQTMMQNAASAENLPS